MQTHAVQGTGRGAPSRALPTHKWPKIPSIPSLLSAHVSPAANLNSRYRCAVSRLYALSALPATRYALRTCNLSQPSTAHVPTLIWTASRRPPTFASRAFCSINRPYSTYVVRFVAPSQALSYIPRPPSSTSSTLGRRLTGCSAWALSS
ncbi:hypothetical protein IQ07DRAFT_89287 [Pyrenochaeta sp. DS3sAY3a]|nr:hypothetical protein IQ07DRAFT_89287 [Pyrenochaeta sp. DS3sAY3a]